MINTLKNAHNSDMSEQMTTLNPTIDATKVFLISGQEAVVKVGDRRGVSPAATQRVVIAADAEAAMRKLAEKEPGFKSLGIASLFDYESTVQRLHAVISGESTEWVLHAE
ncbi:hypothetical protein [Comamonas testosteroni]|uniref:hypothetical protein n=1 Tax=Comamonas testosteroni TaxID=285 RepID=UPI0026EBA3DF|nr:hypothetical protein [Comamonas testosteroni]